MRVPTSQQIVDYEKSLAKHLEYVQKAGELIGVSEELLAHHDESKYSNAEFYHYVHQYFGAANDPIGYSRAWLHHIHHNPHHWQHWIFPDGYELKGANLVNGVMEMPEQYALEMVADWAGASMAYTGSWDMTAWLKTNRFKIRLHPKTAECVIDTIFQYEYCQEHILHRVDGVFSANGNGA